MSLEDQLVDLLSGPKKNLWLEEGPIEIYVRDATRGLPYPFGDFKLARTIDIANVVNHSGTVTKGRFRTFMEFVETVDRDAIYFENVISERLRAILDKNGYQKIGGDSLWPSSYWKPIK